MSLPPILDHKRHDAPSVFEPVALLREARRQKSLAITDVPGLCILDPDGDILRRLKQMGAATRMDTWPCYHTELYSFPLAGRIFGIVRRWRTVRRLGGGRTVCLRVRIPHERYIGRSNYTGWKAALFCDHRSSAEG